MNIRAGLSHAILIATLLGPAQSAIAAHANPWAGPDDEVKSQFHDDNQARSLDTPGEDEMNGIMTRNAHGKLGTAAGGKGGSGGGNGGGSGNGNGGNGGGGGGNGGNGGNGGGQGRN